MANEKSNRVIQVELNHSIREMTIRVRGIDAPLVFHADRVSAVNADRALMLGFKNRIVDTAAKSFDQETKAPASPQVKFDAMAAIVKHLESGSEDWGTRQVRTGAGDDSLLVQALMEVLGNPDRAKVAATVKSWDPAKRAAVRMRDDVKVVLDRLVSEAAADVDTDELLSELM